MNKFLLIIFTFSVLNIFSQTTLYYENFEGTTSTISLNTSDAGAITPGVNDNLWLVNNSYTGGSFLLEGLVLVTIPSTPTHQVVL